MTFMTCLLVHPKVALTGNVARTRGIQRLKGR
jgi:hypothetical protein